nr:MAG TPA: hypothetical protein [Caudoviricetes sp.]
MASTILAVISICIGCYSLGWSLRGLAESFANRDNQRDQADDDCSRR